MRIFENLQKVRFFALIYLVAFFAIIIINCSNNLSNTDLKSINELITKVNELLDAEEGLAIAELDNLRTSLKNVNESKLENKMEEIGWQLDDYEIKKMSDIMVIVNNTYVNIYEIIIGKEFNKEMAIKFDDVLSNIPDNLKVIDEFRRSAIDSFRKSRVHFSGKDLSLAIDVAGDNIKKYIKIAKDSFEQTKSTIESKI